MDFLEYVEFLKQKQVRVQPMGFMPGKLPSRLFDWQRSVTEWSVKRGRAAMFEDCGLGKTGQQLSLIHISAIDRHIAHASRTATTFPLITIIPFFHISTAAPQTTD